MIKIFNPKKSEKKRNTEQIGQLEINPTILIVILKENGLKHYLKGKNI